jgi:inner membrane protein
MLFHTHLLIAVAFFLIVRAFYPAISTPVFLVIMLFGSILPDIDEPKSKINRWSGIFGTILTFFAKHRGFFHSLLFIAIACFFVNLVWNSYYSMALFLGFLAHMIGDGITPMGIKLFYPISHFRIRGPFRVGGGAEKVIMALLLVFIVWRVI